MFQFYEDRTINVLTTIHPIAFLNKFYIISIITFPSSTRDLLKRQLLLYNIKILAVHSTISYHKIVYTFHLFLLYSNVIV